MSAADTGLYKAAYERDSCGFGLIANLDDQPSHWLVQTAITSLNRLTHRVQLPPMAKRATAAVCCSRNRKPFCVRLPQRRVSS